MCGVSPTPVRCETMLPPKRCRKPKPLLPIAVSRTARASPCSSFTLASVRRSALVFRPPHNPLSEVTTMMPTFFTPSRFTRKGWWYSGFAKARCEAMMRILSPYGRAWRMRSWAFLIFEAATISMALVILRVFCTLLILVRISLLPAIYAPLSLPFVTTC